ncbi:hypothetical protein [Aestuariibacter sp. A3R04]|uniref:hypothetical protein n=1 Tax=Aestuariibacter sp. A3R04 TaxID=2841571 RepID=UPI001C098AB0|nr:hypothetical protein [Aestuariibacter sp. A3R04]MBU3021623.1 hypothetical protein [Aestuariibacter sp. A3R04]
MRYPSVKQVISVLITGIVLCVTTLSWSKWTLLISIQQQYAASYQSLVPNKTYSGNLDEEPVNFIVSKISHALEQISPQSRLSILAKCHVTDLVATAPFESGERLRNLLIFRLALDDPYHHLSYIGEFSCRVHWPWLIVSQFSLSLFLFFLLRWIPAPLSRQLAHHIIHWQQLGLTAEQAREAANASEQTREVFKTLILHPSLAEFERDKLLKLISRYELTSVTERESVWLGLLYTHFNKEEQAFVNTFTLPEQLIFDAKKRLLTIKGIEIKLTATPYYYYLWYAQKRIQTDDGWVLNPLTSKADHELAAELIALMEQFGGHGKAINDLIRNGLTAKKLDQNRNKIKDELNSVLGESLATPFLFEGQREQSSSRYFYRIQAPKEKFKIL